MSDRDFMALAVEEARKSQPEDNQPRPRVGVVFARDGQLLAQAYRNEDGQGSHAEYLALMKLAARGLTAEGASVYTTLEPCVHRKSKNKIPCASRLVDAKVGRVFYAVIDPHKTVQSKGLLHLRNHQIPVESFPADLAEAVEELNRPFLRAFTRGEATLEFVEANRRRSLDDWYRTVNRIYWRQNAGQDPAVLFGHLVETFGVISSLETGKQKHGVDACKFIVKALAWWLTLCGRLRVRSVEAMVWSKFPRVCPYCLKSPHTSACHFENRSPDWHQLGTVGLDSIRPSSIGEWQRMFRDIYPQTSLLPAGRVYAHMVEELGELSEAVRVFELVPGLFLSEAPDVFAWILQAQNFLDSQSPTPGDALEMAFCAAYPDLCPYCAAEECECPGILPSTVGRLGGAISPTAGDGMGSAFLTVDKASERFGF